VPNPKHLEILQGGVQAWNAWRKANPSVKPDLVGADLRRRVLRSVDLSRSNLAGSDLRDSSLRHADLTRAKLDGGRLHRVVFSHTLLDETSFKGAVLYETVFSDVVLSTAKHLNTCIHKGPSVVDHRTLRSSGSLPIDFLRGCGLPDSLIINADNDQRRELAYSSCFISYSSKNQDFADRLYTDLQSSNVRCWFAPKDIPIGARVRDAIDEGIRDKDRVLLILSEESVSSSWVEKEVETAFEEETLRSSIVLFPIRIDDAVMSTAKSWARDIKRARHIGDFSGWKNHDVYRQALRKLLRDLRSEARRGSTPA
jgi:hypothetical protein